LHHGNNKRLCTVKAVSTNVALTGYAAAIVAAVPVVMPCASTLWSRKRTTSYILAGLRGSWHHYQPPGFRAIDMPGSIFVGELCLTQTSPCKTKRTLATRVPRTRAHPRRCHARKPAIRLHVSLRAIPIARLLCAPTVHTSAKVPRSTTFPGNVQVPESSAPSKSRLRCCARECPEWPCNSNRVRRC